MMPYLQPGHFGRIPPDARLPALYAAASTASFRGQRGYSLLYGMSLFLLVVGAILSSVSFSTGVGRQTLAVGGACAFVLTLFFSGAIRFTKAQVNWYYGRALAEAVKELSWRYMMAVGPYGPGDEAAIRDRFLSDLARLRRQCPALLLAGAPEADRPQISEAMDRIRSLPVAERARIYAEERLTAQRKWYAGKASGNERAARGLIWCILLAELIATLLAVLQILQIDPPLNSAAILASIAAAFIAWLHLKQHDQLAMSYSNTEQELASIGSQSPEVIGEEQLAARVDRAEAVISREHQIWMARRDVDLDREPC